MQDPKQTPFSRAAKIAALAHLTAPSATATSVHDPFQLSQVRFPCAAPQGLYLTIYRTDPSLFPGNAKPNCMSPTGRSKDAARNRRWTMHKDTGRGAITRRGQFGAVSTNLRNVPRKFSSFVVYLQMFFFMYVPVRIIVDKIVSIHEQVLLLFHCCGITVPSSSCVLMLYSWLIFEEDEAVSSISEELGHIFWRS